VAWQRGAYAEAHARWDRYQGEHVLPGDDDVRCLGRSNKEIGDELSLYALTVKSHLVRIGRKLGTGDRAEMVALTMRTGVIR
jgi:hypothetical protein